MNIAPHHYFRSAATLLLLVTLAPIMSAQAARDVAEQRECSTCHLMWLNDFKREDVDTLVPYDPAPVAESGQQDVSSTSPMCLSCHDGFVLDSRAIWKEGHQGHPVGMEPSDAITQPLVDGKNLFPLNEDGKVYCGTCHTAHGVDWETKDSPVFMRVNRLDTDLCQACHADHQEGPVRGNHPVNVVVDPLPNQVGTQNLSVNSKNEVTCQSCHGAHGSDDEKLLVAANDNSELCRACHTDQDAATLQVAAEAGTHPVNIEPIEAKLSNTLLEHGGHLGDSEQLICQSCHAPHQAKSDDGILIVKNKNSDLCMLCHEKKNQVIGSQHDLSAQTDSDGTCEVCHRAHGGRGPKIWARESPVGTDPMSGLCLGCHATGGSATDHQIGEHSHPVGVAIATLGHPVDLPAFTTLGVLTDNADTGMVSCSSCHDTHLGTAGSSFLRQANDRESTLCRACHEDKWQLAGTGHDMATSQPESTNAAGVMAEEAGMCGSCHQPHNGLGPAMWAREVSTAAAPVTATCLSCHGEQGPAQARPSDQHSHPVGVSIDKLEIAIDAHGWSSEAPAIEGPPTLTPLPLYDEQGNAIADSKLVGCGSCHDPHGAETETNSKFMRMADFEPDELCTNCHVEKDLIRLSPHRQPEQNTNSICASCHRAHAGEAAYMWAETPGPGQQPVEQLCTSCHQVDGEADDKLIGEHSHPIGMTMDDNSTVDCSSCHDTHQWDPNNPLSRDGLEDGINGDVNTSFLRTGDEHGGLCATCHEGYSDVFGTDHDLSITAVKAKNLAGQSVTEAGLCGHCHMPHNASSERALWAQELSDDAHLGDGFCLGCHSPKGIANTKVPAETYHPQGDVFWPTDGIPVINSRLDPVKPGEIGCHSCHDPHNWSPGNRVTRAGVNAEGDVQSSFLRLQSTRNFMCADCHGKDALFRYLYFHSPRSRTQ